MSLENIKINDKKLQDNVIYTNDQLSDYINILENSDFYYNGQRINFSASFVDGYYVHDDYYCVWTKNRTIEYINETEHHEICHELISKDIDNHFCAVKNAE